MRKATRLPLLLSFSLLSSPAPGSPSPPIDKMIQEFIKAHRVPGLSLAVIEKGSSIFRNYGYADTRKKIPTSNDTVYAIASFTKTFTATLSAIAAVEQKIDLSAPIFSYFPELKEQRRATSITATHLLAHVSSLPFDFAPRPASYAAMVQNLRQFSSTTAVGSIYSYSNAGIGTMGYVLQQVYAKKYQDILQEKILQPLGMTATRLKNPGIWFAAGDLTSTIGDMARYLQANMSNVDSANSTLGQAFALVHRHYFCFADRISCQQLGWQAHHLSALDSASADPWFLRYDANGKPIFGKKEIVDNNKEFEKSQIFIDKSAAGYGMSGYMAYLPEQKKGVVLLFNKKLGAERITLGRTILKRL